MATFAATAQGRYPNQRWAVFVRNHAEGIVACELPWSYERRRYSRHSGRYENSRMVTLNSITFRTVVCCILLNSADTVAQQHHYVRASGPQHFSYQQLVTLSEQEQLPSELQIKLSA